MRMKQKKSKHTDFGETCVYSDEKPVNNRNPSIIISDSALNCKEEDFAMDNLVVKNVDLFGDTIMAAQDAEGRVWAGVKWFCDGLGLTEGQTRNERLKIQEDLALRQGGRKIALPTNGGTQETLCLKLEFLPLWLAKITLTPTMRRENPDSVNKLVQYQLKAKDVLAEAFLTKKKEVKDKPKRLPLSSVNMMVKNVMSTLEKAKVEPVYVAAEVKRLYTDLGYEVKAPLITDKEDMPKLYDCTEIATELGIYSSSGKPHNQAVGAIIKKLHISNTEIVTTAFSKNGHEDVTTQYKSSVLKEVKWWIAENGYPTKISYCDSKGNCKSCTVVYRGVA